VKEKPQVKAEEIEITPVSVPEQEAKTHAIVEEIVAE
jgi:hypothetical protein